MAVWRIGPRERLQDVVDCAPPGTVLVLSPATTGKSSSSKRLHLRCAAPIPAQRGSFSGIMHEIRIKSAVRSAHFVHIQSP